jgi:hypothetical protein
MDIDRTSADDNMLIGTGRLDYCMKHMEVFLENNEVNIQEANFQVSQSFSLSKRNDNKDRNVDKFYSL